VERDKSEGILGEMSNARIRFKGDSAGEPRSIYLNQKHSEHGEGFGFCCGPERAGRKKGGTKRKKKKAKGKKKEKKIC